MCRGEQRDRFQEFCGEFVGQDSVESLFGVVSESATAMLTTGQIVEVEVQAVAYFGLFCRHEEQDVLVLIPEISWIASFCSLHQFAEPGDRFTVKIIHVDVDRGKISGSITALHPDPWVGGQLASGTEHQGRVVRYVEKSDRCKDGPGYLLELMPGAYVMVCADGLSLEKNQRYSVTVCESDVSKRAVRVAINESNPLKTEI